MDLEQFTLSMMLLGFERITRDQQCTVNYCDRYMWSVPTKHRHLRLNVYTTAMSETGDIYIGKRYRSSREPFQQILDKVIAFLEKHKPTESK